MDDIIRIAVFQCGSPHSTVFSICSTLLFLMPRTSLNPFRLILLGAPGSGKGTQTAWLKKDFPQFSSISSGDVMRAEVARGSTLGEQTAQFIERGELVPDVIITNTVTGELERRGWLNSKLSWLLDGFPRTVGQAQHLDTVLHKAHADLTMVVELKVDQKKIMERIESRWIHRPSGRVYNLGFNPPKTPFRDDVTGEPLEKRDDDSAKVFQERLAIFNKTVTPLREYYEKKGVLRSVAGDTSDAIFPQLRKLITDRK